ncbi:uncharacterized protein [Argopecten irradians]|uniref:uncharacterized protein n=1 Tax=Argopecten irradians TaxID=31199 RepID=UPI003711C841
MENWQHLCRLSDRDTIAAFGGHFEGAALVWLNGLPPSEKANMITFKQAFDRRFKSAAMNFKFMTMKQADAEEPQTYLATAEKEGLKQPTLSEDVKVMIITNGLTPKYKARVLGREPKTFTDLRHSLDIVQAELACANLTINQEKPKLPDDNQQMASIMSTILTEINKLRQAQEVSSVQTDRGRSRQHPQQPPHQFYRQQQNRGQNQRQCPGCGFYGPSLVWSLLLMVLVWLPIVVATQPPVQRLNYGILFEPNSKLHFGQEFWSHTFEIPLPSSMYLPELNPCRRRRCESLYSVVKTINNLRAQCMSNVNVTIAEIHRLIPHSYFPNSLSFNSRRKRGLFDFIGQISKSLFGTATTNDLQNLQRHIQALNNNNVKLAKAMAKEAYQLTSFMTTVNERFDNVIDAVKTNHDQSITLANQFASSLDGIEHSFVLLENMMLTQINATTVLNKHLEHTKLAIHDLVKGRLSPFLLSPKDISHTLRQVQNILSRKYPGFNIIHKDPLYYYSSADFLFARHHSSLYVLLKFPISPFVKPLSRTLQSVLCSSSYQLYFKSCYPVT